MGGGDVFPPLGASVRLSIYIKTRGDHNYFYMCRTTTTNSGASNSSSTIPPPTGASGPAHGISAARHNAAVLHARREQQRRIMVPAPGSSVSGSDETSGPGGAATGPDDHTQHSTSTQGAPGAQASHQQNASRSGPHWGSSGSVLTETSRRVGLAERMDLLGAWGTLEDCSPMEGSAQTSISGESRRRGSAGRDFLCWGR